MRGLSKRGQVAEVVPGIQCFMQYPTPAINGRASICCGLLRLIEALCGFGKVLGRLGDLLGRPRASSNLYVNKGAGLKDLRRL